MRDATTAHLVPAPSWIDRIDLACPDHGTGGYVLDLDPETGKPFPDSLLRLTSRNYGKAVAAMLRRALEGEDVGE